MMQKKWSRLKRREKQRKQNGLLPVVMLLCMTTLFFLPRLFMQQADLYTRILSLQFPYLLSSSGVIAEESAPVEEVKPDIDESVSDIFRVELEQVRSTRSITLAQDAPSILIYHTHTSEAYRQDPNAPYEESGDWRTHDNDKNIVAVGEKLATLLKEQYGLNVLHDITDHEPPKLSTSYSRSVKTMQAYKEKYPSITMFIDVHRDAYGTENGKQDYVVINGKECAKLMFVVGTGEGATGSGFGEMPDFKSNYALAAAISTRLRQFNPTLARDIRVKTGRYNQHISNQCLLVEVGHNMNTLEQALNSIDYLAQAIGGIAQQKVSSDGKLSP